MKGFDQSKYEIHADVIAKQEAPKAQPGKSKRPSNLSQTVVKIDVEKSNRT